MYRPVTKKDYVYAISWVYRLEEKLKNNEYVGKWEIDSCRYTIKTYRALMQNLILQSDDAIVLVNQLADKECFKLSKDTLLTECGLSCRARNVLAANDTYDGHEIRKIGDLQHISIGSLKSFRNTGEKTAEEIIKLCHSVGVKLKR
jgi:DNA-directed RNA polymerase alpha subunit